MKKYTVDSRGTVDVLIREDHAKEKAEDIYQWWFYKQNKWIPMLGGIPFRGKEVSEEKAKQLFPDAFK